MLGAFHSRELRLLWVGLATANLGFQVQQFAIAWIIVVLATKEGGPGLAAFYLGLRGIVTLVPALAVGLVAGSISDRVDRRRLLIAGRLMAAAVSLALLALELTGATTLPLLFVVLCLSGAVINSDIPARQALISLAARCSSPRRSARSYPASSSSTSASPGRSRSTSCCSWSRRPRSSRCARTRPTRGPRARRCSARCARGGRTRGSPRRSAGRSPCG
ncbi:MAG: MFS transporter [Chloroflexi bacterium]|nr:MFS transporter [Chloroflexota bacterium]